MWTTIATWGALIGLAIAIVLIIFKLHPVYALIVGALVGGLIGSAGNIQLTVTSMVDGAKGMVFTILRILTSGILAGALIKTGSAEKIATTIVKGLGDKLALVSIAIATMIICAVGVFIDISVITVAPIALSVASKVKVHKVPVLLAMIGGGKAGNIISPNPNTLAIIDKETGFNIQLTDMIARNIVPAILALGVTILIAYLLARHYKKKKELPEVKGDTKKIVKAKKQKREVEPKLPNIFLALLGPIVVIVILILRPTANVDIDPLIALPVGGIVTILVTGHYKETISITAFGLSKVVGIAVLLLGTGTIAGVIAASNLKNDFITLLQATSMPAFLLAPLSGFLFAAATASTTSGATLSTQTFATTLIEQGVSAKGAAAMINASATILDSLPHGSFFHATGGSVAMEFKERLKLIPFEALIGLTSTVASIIVYLIFH